MQIAPKAAHVNHLNAIQCNADQYYKTIVLKISFLTRAMENVI